MSSQKHILVYIARHGTTILNQQDAFRGPIDVPLDAAGIRDAHQLAYYFEPIELSHIVHSDRIRTRMTASVVAERKSMPHVANEHLRAWNVGDLGGQPKNKENEAIVDWHVDHPDDPMPGGESLNAFKNRVRPVIGGAIEVAMECGVPVLLVAHSSVIHEVGTAIGGDHEYTLVEPGGVAAIYVQNGTLDAEPIFKPRPVSKQADLT